MSHPWYRVKTLGGNRSTRREYSGAPHRVTKYTQRLPPTRTRGDANLAGSGFARGLGGSIVLCSTRRPWSSGRVQVFRSRLFVTHSRVETKGFTDLSGSAPQSGMDRGGHQETPILCTARQADQGVGGRLIVHSLFF